MPGAHIEKYWGLELSRQGGDGYDGENCEGLAISKGSFKIRSDAHIFGLCL